MEIQESNVPQLKGQAFTIEFTKVVEDGKDTKAEIYSVSGDRKGKLIRHN